jgi:hypothetical protein
MQMHVLILPLVASLAIAAFVALRRGMRAAAPAAPAPVPVPPVQSAEEPGEIVFDPAELQNVPVLSAAPVQILQPEEIFRRLRQLELGVAELGRPLPEHEHIVVAALAVIADPATQRKYAPRRPNLLPQLMRSLNDEDVSRRELAAIIARDPSLVGSLLKMANSSYYRTYQPIETIERAVVILGSDGLRSLIAAALMQPIFQVSHAGSFQRFPEIVWDHALRSAHASIPHAALVERADPFAAELLSLICGLAEIVLFRAAMDYFAGSSRKAPPDPVVIASLLASQTAAFAWQIGAGWELSELTLAALEEQMVEADPTTPLGRSLRFGRLAGALAVLHSNSIVDEATLKVSLPDGGLSLPHLKCMWTRLLQKQEDPRTARRAPSREAGRPSGRKVA